MTAMPPGLFIQHSRLLRLTTPLGADELLAECVRGEEALGRGFRFDVAALSLRADVRLRSLLGQPALLALQTPSGERHFHGHVTAAEMLGANGGMARYKLTLEPWTAFLARTRDSRIFQDMTVFDILDAVFGAWQGQGKLAPAWRYDLRDRAVYPRRSLTTQYQESDLAFAERLMAEEGLFHFYTHTGDAAAPTLGSHELVIADHNAAFQPNPQAAVRYTQPGAVMREDSMDRWRAEYRLQTNAVELQSWDYRTRDTRAASASGEQAEGVSLISNDVPGAYAYASREQGQRMAAIAVEALEAAKEIHVGAGTVRTLAPGTTFTLTEHALADEEFAVLRVVHLMHNNLSAELSAGVQERLGGSPLSLAIADEGQTSLHAVGREAGERPLYRNRVDAIRGAVPYRAPRDDAHGVPLRPRPTVRGQQTGIVVGPLGAVIHTDRDHRVKVQMHWQRGDAGQNRLPHPAPDTHTGAPGDDSAGTWLRVATPLAPVAGANWGANALPRVGQEVLVDFLEGDIDRPVVIGALYNGQGGEDAPQNQAAQGSSPATGNAPAWFPGTGGAHAHPAVFSGLKSQAMQSSQAGGGAYSQLLFDDSDGQPRLALQHHAKQHTGTAELNLGHLRHQSDNERLAPSGFGAELKTEHSVALRAGRGMLLSADQRQGASGAQLDSREAVGQIEQSQQLAAALADTAAKHNAVLGAAGASSGAGGASGASGGASGSGSGAGGAAAPEAGSSLPAIEQLARTAEAASASDNGAGAGEAEGGAGSAISYGAALLQLSTPSGIAALTPANAILGAGSNSSVTAGQDINFAVQGNALHTVGGGISLFTYGKASKADKPNQETGLKLHAASGKLSSQSQAGPTRVTADKGITVASTAKSINIAAKSHVRLTAQGAWIKLEGGNIEVHGPGKMEFKASQKELTGPQSASPTLPHMPKAGEMDNFLELNYRWDDMQPMVGAPYKVLFDTGVTIAGKLDAQGFARLENIPNAGATVVYGEDERDAVLRKPLKPNAVAGAKPKTDEEAKAILDAYLAQEDAYYKDNFFPDEIAEMADAMGDGVSELEYDFHYDDYRYADEDSPASREAERGYRELHEGDEEQA
ncbi:type VI secretion system Vgr family protein [Pseudoduganella namucuonensis]|uniref:Rhs element Vgr protein n=1 Tax=Pseudoduganella namucuonensis TaxID=1035707 RepID=A0A1I7JFM0_9BURK|nr:type VI secretion system Vgr family protein [Pseudoduganella namucuonensis]SFU83946.1 Rhs element Vgr protein [Pseudoduganella namucuonensis]